jgi:hypothetical protein
MATQSTNASGSDVAPADAGISDTGNGKGPDKG